MNKEQVEKANVIDVNKIVDTQSFGAFNCIVIASLFLLLLIEGYDSGIVGIGAPYIIEAWNIQDVKQLGPVFSASVIGVMLGSLTLGYLGDLIGRKPVLLVSSIVVAISTLLIAWASTINQLIILRFLTGLGVGGVVPLAVVLLAEFSPKRTRSTIVALGGVGVASGHALTGIIGATLASTWGWEVMFWIGGVIPILICTFIYTFMPESPKYLVSHGNRDELIKVLRKVKSDLVINPDTQFIITHDAVIDADNPTSLVLMKQIPQSRISIAQLFDGHLRLVTPLLWFLYTMLGFPIYIFVVWLPTILTHGLGLTVQLAGTAVVVYQTGALLSPPVIGYLIDKYGMRPLLVYTTFGVPIIASLGLLHQPTVMLPLLFIAGFLLIGCNMGFLAVAANILYPTWARGKGVGFVSGLQKLGMMAGAMAGGYLMDLPHEILFIVVAVPLAFSALGTWALVQITSANN